MISWNRNYTLWTNISTCVAQLANGKKRTVQTIKMSSPIITHDGFGQNKTKIKDQKFVSYN